MSQTATKPLLPPTERVLTKDRRAVVLAFPPQGDAPGGRYAIAGGIAWPREVESEGGRLYGHALVLGRHEASGAVYAFEEREFVVLEAFRSGEDLAPRAALAGFLADAWAKYLCLTWHNNDPALMSSIWRASLHKAASVQPKPSVCEADWGEDAVARAMIAALAEAGCLRFKAGGALARALALMESEPGLPELPAARALASALVGLSRMRMEAAA
jgi:hypothetical protein